MVEQIFTCIVLSKWFEILREPGELLSFWNRHLIGVDETDPITYKILTCSLCHSGYFALFCILFKDASFVVLPATMVIYHFLNTKVFK